MKNLKIQIFKSKSDVEAEVSVTLPFTALHIAIKLLPKKITAILENENIDLAPCKDLVKEKVFIGTLIEIENPNERMVISVE